MKSQNWISPFVLGLVLVVPATVSAQANSTPQPRRLSQSQLDVFAAVVDEDPSVVERRLLWDPSLGQFAAAAADARVSRRRLGTAMTVGGFATMGLGLLVGSVIWVSGIRLFSDCPYEGGSNCQSPGNDEDQMSKGVIVALASTVVGLAVGIPGVAMLRGTSEAEKDAIQQYRARESWPRPIAPAPYSRAFPGGPAGKTFNLSLLSVAF
jgi:hypothetical protein